MLTSNSSNPSRKERSIMKATPLLLVLSILTFALPSKGMIEKVIGDFREIGFNHFRSDLVADGTSVDAKLTDDPTKKCWRLEFTDSLTGSPNLTTNLDFTAGDDIDLEVQKFPNGNAQAVKSIYIQGFDVRDFSYSDVTDLIKFKIRPVASPAITVGHTNPMTAGAAIYFFYSGVFEAPISYSPPVIIGNVSPDAIELPQHPSSQLLQGTAVRVDGIQGEQVRLEYLIGSTYADRWGLDINAFRGYIDGEEPASGDSATLPATPSYSVDMGKPGEEFVDIKMLIRNFSPHDIQVGVFPEPLGFTDISREAGGVRLTWNPEAGKSYTLQYFLTLGGAPNVLATGLTGPEFLDTDTGNTTRFYRLVEE